ncbi:hypothetical protein Afil01_49800 [Actinorhabdospora filicis]|uniref:TPR repeat domain-containing protein n=1 Tax=Actinorhabdospora filicis TaxID=1785913 RepID=A0A9W6SQB8_9ACTN|nr:hypothetical protein [Actinorhabdospora filicis]GLZ80173.1 hypothetical protein Afil01_49800 [Actinorhabdospora filicis]
MAFDTSPWETKADEAAVSGEANTLMSLAGRITGRGGELRDAINAGAMEFSDIVADPIEARNRDNVTSWVSGTQATVFGSSILTAWAGEVGTFKRELAALDTRYAEGVNRIFEIGTGGPGEGANSVGRNAAQKSLEAELTAEAVRLRAKFDTDTESRGAQLRSGPTTEVLKALVSDGTMKWAAFNLWGAKGAVPLDGKDAKKLAEMLVAKLKGGGKLTQADRELLINLQALAGHALWMQKHGGNLSKGELAYLKTLFGELNRGYNGDDTPFRGDSALLNIDAWLKGSGYGAADQSLIRGALGGGLLALSDDGIGGGYELLPSDVRRSLEAELPETWDIPAGEGAEGFWRAEFVPLAALLGAAPALQGGLKFSGLLTLRSAEYASMLDEKEDVEPLQTLLGVATRNHEAVREVLTGGYRTERFGADTPEFVLRQLFGKNDWTDGGAAAAKLVDWIPAASRGSDSYERYLAGVSSAAVIDILTNTHKTAWDQSAFQFFTDSGGRIGDATDVPMGVANPKISQALGDVASAYLQSFGGRDGVEGAKTQWGYMVSGPNGEVWVPDKLQIDPDDRARFFQLIVADPKAAAQLGNDILGTMYRNTGDMVGTDDPGARGSLAATSGRLLGYFDAALKNNMLDAVGDHERAEATAYGDEVAKNQRITGIMSGGIGFAFNQANNSVSAWDNNYALAHGGRSLGGPTGGVFLRNLPVNVVQGVVGGFVPFFIDAPTAPDPNDVDMRPVVGHISPEKFDLLTKHSMLDHAIDQGKVDVKDLDKGLLNEDGTRLRDLGANEDVPRVQAQLRDQLIKAGLRDLVENGQFDVYRYAKSVDDAQDSWQEYQQWRNNEKQ